MGSPGYVLATWLFLRLLGLIYLSAFVSLAVQVRGLIGREGILPAAEFLSGRSHDGISRFWKLPTLCWLNASDAFLLVLSWGGALLALLLTLGFAPLLVLPLLWVSYLSLLNVSRLFLGYQWDILLLETGLLAIFLAPPDLQPDFPPTCAPSPVILGLCWWLLFRLMFSSGAVKLRSGDRTWRNLTALSYHYQTQPLPTPAAWYAHQLPVRFHKASAVLMFAIELLAPFLIVGPPALRHVAAASFIFLMVLIQLTGNYCFFNFLGIALSILLLDDCLLLPLFRLAWPGMPLTLHVAPLAPAFNGLALGVALLTVSLSLPPLLLLFRAGINWPKSLASFFGFFEPFHLVNSYGLFAVMTTERPEIIVEGSEDGTNWRAYEFRWKPGELERAPRFVAPHQPRLDWQMWFAALGFYQYNPWFARFLQRLLEGSPTVLGLLRRNPFPQAPPRVIRVMVYDYQFTTRTERRATGRWWRAEPRGAYCAMVGRGNDADDSARE